MGPARRSSILRARGSRTGRGAKGAWLRRFRHAERKLGRTGRSSLRALPAAGKPARRRLAALGPVRRLRRDRPAKLAGRCQQRHDAVARDACAGSCAKCTKRRPRPAAVDLNLLLLAGVAGGVYLRLSLPAATFTACAADTTAGARARGRATCCWPTRSATALPAATGSTTWASARCASKRHFQTRLASHPALQPLPAAGVARSNCCA